MAANWRTANYEQGNRRVAIDYYTARCTAICPSFGMPAEKPLGVSASIDS